MEKLYDVCGVEDRRQRRRCVFRASLDPRHVIVARRAARASSVSSARRLRFSTSASFSMLGQAQSSPIVNGATRW
jgi:hypothetical protein